ncbi:MAG: NHL repeat-containing protein [Kastovskya adunca ATA6-11-RM4]|jgi:sugar lactone lactonase YvrE|nr:NHL repeat-containing protein [Kastovskya adunca ATA6-11-RM4]
MNLSFLPFPSSPDQECRYLIGKTFPNLLASVVLGTVATLSLGSSSATAALLVGNTRGDNVVLFDDRTGDFLGEFIPSGSGGLLSPDDLNFGPDGNLYVTSGNTPETSAVLRYDGKTGAFIDVFASGNGLFRPYGAAFGADGNLYVSSFLSDQILRYDGKTGAFIDVFASGNGQPGSLNGPNDLLFGADGSLYVTTQGSVAVNGEPDFSRGLPSQVLRFDMTTRTSTVFVDQPTPSPDSFGFVSFLGLALGANGDLFVSDFANDIQRYNLATGTLIDSLSANYTGTVPSNNFIGNLTFGLDNTLYTVGFDLTNNNFGAILRYDGVTREALPAPGNEGAVFVATTPQLLRPVGITFTSQPLASVPEPTATVGLLTFGTFFMASRWKRQRN